MKYCCLLLVLTISFTTIADSQKYSKALAAYNKERYSIAEPLFRELSTQENDKHAQFALALIYERGLGDFQIN